MAVQILIVEDESVVALDLRTRLTRLGYSVADTVARGEDAVEVAERLRPDLILMDIRLRGAMDGITAAEIIRTRLRLPIVYLTAHADAATVDRARITEPFGYILKPFEERELRTVIEMALYKHEADRKLRESERRYATTLSSLGVAVIAADAGGRVTFMNPTAERLTGWSGTEAVGVPLATVFEIRHEETQAIIENPIAMFLSESVPGGLTSQAILISRNGESCPIDNCAAPILDDREQMAGAVLVFRDVSESRRVEEHMRHAQKMEAVGQLAGGIAHDFNNMLTIILNYSNILLDAAGRDHVWSGFLREIHDAGERSADLTRQLLTFCRRQVIEPRIVDLNEVVLRAEQMLRRLIGENIELEVCLQPELSKVEVDPGQIERVLVNLAVNARDAMSEQGRLLIQTTHVEFRENRVAKLAVGTYICLRVTDSGSGISAANRVRIFEPFFTTKEPGKGTGLGLATVYGIVRQCGGHIEFDTEVGRGTTFSVYLPVATERSAPGPTLDPRELPKGTETILLVEDEVAVRSLSRYILSTCGYNVLEAENGEEAIRVARQFAGRIDVVVTDVVMPVMGAQKMLQHLRPFLREMKVILLSGYSSDNLMPEFADIHQVTFLQKPFTLSELMNTVRRMLDGVADRPYWNELAS